MNMLRSKPELLFLFLVFHLGNWVFRNTSGSVPDVVESEVKSWVVERRLSPLYDIFTVNMKPAFRCYHEWCWHKFEAFPHAIPMDGNRTCRCECTRNGGFASFLPSLRRCINARMAASFAGCQRYFNNRTLLDTPVDLTKQKSRNDQTFQFLSDSICNLNASYFYDYEGFHSNWRQVAGFFELNVRKEAKSYSVQWKPDRRQILSGRIVRLNVTCGAFTRCFLFKALGSVIYKNGSSPWSSSSTTSLPSISSSLSSSSSSSLLTSSLSSDLSPVSSSLQLSLSSMPWSPSSSSLLQLKKSSVTSDLSPISSSLQLPLSSMSWSPSSSSLLTKSSVTSISSANFSQSPTSVKTSSSEMLLLKPTSSYSTSNTLTMPTMEPSWVTPTSTAAFIESGSKERQTEEKGSGVLIAAAVGSTLLAGAVFLILLICWRKRRARESKRMERKHVEVGNPVYGISNDEFQMEKAKGSAQDGQQRYQYPSNTGQSVGETVYSNPDSNYDNCAVYQSLEKPTPGSPVYQSLEEQIPEASVYQRLNSDQEKPSGRTALKNVSPKQSTLPNPKSSASDQLNPTAAGLGCAPNPKERRDTKRALPNTYSALTQKPTYNLRHEADAGQETTPGALYVDLEGPTSGQDYETLNGDDQYLAPIETNAQIGFEKPCARKDQVYVELEGPDAQNGFEHEPGDAQEPLYNMLEDPNEGKSPKVEPSDSSFDPLYIVLEEIDSDGSKKPEPPRGHDNPAYEETLDFGHPYATPQRPGAQTESVYEPLRKASTLDPYTA